MSRDLEIARSASPFAASVLAGQPQAGTGFGHGYVAFADRVLALTSPGAPRMPNGIECDLVVAPGERVLAGDGTISLDNRRIALGPLWDPRPQPRVLLSLRPRPRLRLGALAGRGPGLTPLGDDILVGYLAACALWGDVDDHLVALAESASSRTNSLGGTLLRLALRGCLPEAAHYLLVDGDPGPLLRFGATSGAGIAFGLALFGCAGRLEQGADEERLPDLSRYEIVIRPQVAAPCRLGR